MERLGNLIFEVANSWLCHKSHSLDKKIKEYNCSLFECQNINTAFHPEFRNGNAYWECSITEDSGNTWEKAELSIPKWLYDMYIDGEINSISSGLVEVHKLEIA